MQKEIAQLRSQIKDQQQQLVADDSKLTAKCATLTDKVCMQYMTSEAQTTDHGFTTHCGLRSWTECGSTLCLKNWARTLCRITVTKNRTLYIKFGTVNRKSVSYNLPLQVAQLGRHFGIFAPPL